MIHMYHADKESGAAFYWIFKKKSPGVIFTRARVSLALLSLRKNGGLLVVYPFGVWNESIENRKQ